MRRWRKLVAAACLAAAAITGGVASAAEPGKPEGEMRFAVYVTIAPAWLDPGQVTQGFLSSFWFNYGLHDALVKPMPDNPMAPSLAESWTESPDHFSYQFKLRKGLQFHNGDPFTADDVKFSFERAKGVEIHQKVKEVEIVDPYTVRFVMPAPWPDFMAYYGTLASAAGWITPKKYIEKVGPDGFLKHPIGLGPYKFVSQNPGVDLVMEANEHYWRKVPSVKRLVFKSVPEGTTRLAMLKRGEVDVAYLLEGELGETIRNDPQLKLVFSGGVGSHVLDFFDMWTPKSPWHDVRVRKAASLALDRKALSDAATLGASRPTGSIVFPKMEYAKTYEPDPYDPEAAKKLLAEAGYPNGFDAGDMYAIPPYFSTGEAISGYLGAIGIKTRLRTMERAAYFTGLAAKKFKGVCFCSVSGYGNASTRMAAIVPSDGIWAYGGWPDLDELFKKQLHETDTKKREAMLHEIQKIVHDRVRVAPIWEYFWPSGIGPRVAEASLMKIDPFPWSAPLEDVKLKQQ
ncbi:MAG: ABC transporter substrate-binding protein [Thiohalocapsa sp.]